VDVCSNSSDVRVSESEVFSSPDDARDFNAMCGRWLLWLWLWLWLWLCLGEMLMLLFGEMNAAVLVAVVAGARAWKARAEGSLLDEVRVARAPTYVRHV